MRRNKKGCSHWQRTPVGWRGRGFERTISRILSLRCRAGSTGGNHLSGTPVTWRLKRPTRELTDEQSASVHQVYTIPSAWSCSEWGLPSQPVTWLLVSSYLTISPLPDRRPVGSPSNLEVVGRYVSVALSLRSPSLDVIQHPALWSSDFPRALQPAIACFTQTHHV